MQLFHKFIHKVSTIFHTYKVFVELVPITLTFARFRGSLLFIVTVMLRIIMYFFP
jgi:hypothetical protein